MDGNDSRRIDRLEAILRSAHTRRPQPQPVQGLADSVLAAIKAGPVAATPPVADNTPRRIDRLEDVLRQAHARRLPPPLGAGMAASVLAPTAPHSAQASMAAPNTLLPSTRWTKVLGDFMVSAPE